MTSSHIYHLVEEARWRDAGAEGYRPPTYATDGFIHATREAELLIPVANHFYTGIPLYKFRLLRYLKYLSITDFFRRFFETIFSGT